jgi:hypothetical protein
MQHGLFDATMVTPTGTLWLGITVIVNALDITGLLVRQEALEFRVQVTTSLSLGRYMKTGLLTPAFVPFTFHWYEGDGPPFTGVAVNVTGVFWHTVVAEAVMVTPACCSGLTTIVIALEVAGFPIGQPALDVSIQVTWSPF